MDANGLCARRCRRLAEHLLHRITLGLQRGITLRPGRTPTWRSSRRTLTSDSARAGSALRRTGRNRWSGRWPTLLLARRGGTGPVDRVRQCRDLLLARTTTREQELTVETCRRPRALGGNLLISVAGVSWRANAGSSAGVRVVCAFHCSADRAPRLGEIAVGGQRCRIRGATRIAAGVAFGVWPLSRGPCHVVEPQADSALGCWRARRRRVLVTAEIALSSFSWSARRC